MCTLQGTHLELIYAGARQVGWYNPSEKRVDSLKNFPQPTDISSLRGFLGLANQLGHFVPDLAQMTFHLRGLLCKERAFVWLDEHQQEFEQVKKLLCSPLVLASFDPLKKFFVN